MMPTSKAFNEFEPNLEEIIEKVCMIHCALCRSADLVGCHGHQAIIIGFRGDNR